MAAATPPPRGRRARRLATVSIAAALAACSGPARPIEPTPTKPTTGDPVQAVIEAHLDAVMPNAPDAGLVVGVLQGSRARTYGYGGVRPDLAASPNGDTVYPLGSLSAMFTGILLADALVGGEVTLDDPVRAHLPDGATLPRGADSDDGPMTLGHLATNSAGLPAQLPRGKKRRGRGGVTIKRFYQRLAAINLVHPPGRPPPADDSEVRANEVGMALLGLALSHRAGRDYESLLLERIALPLGLSATRQTLPKALHARLAAGYDRAGQLLPARRAADPAMVGCCGLYASTQDLLRVAGAYLRPDGRMSAALAHTLGIPPNTGADTKRDSRRAPPAPGTVGFGWRASGTPTVYQISGSGPGSRVVLALQRERGLAVVVSANAAGWPIETLSGAVMDHLIEHAPPARQPTPEAALAPPTDSLVDIPGGTFVMGDARGNPNEAPRTVTVAPYRLMRYEVTNAQFSAFVDATGYTTDAERLGRGAVWRQRRWSRVADADWRAPHGADSAAIADHPVVQVSWRDAVAFCAYYGLRLPSEAEWEFAARGTDGRRYAWGDEPPRQRAPYRGNTGTIARCCARDGSDGYAELAPVGQYPAGASPFGLLDMMGNVWEWTADPFPGRPHLITLRGGGWGNSRYCLRAAYRHANPKDLGLSMVGVRCAANAASTIGTGSAPGAG